MVPFQTFRQTQIKRQQDTGYLAAVTDLAEGRPLEGFDSLSRKRRPFQPQAY